MSRELLQAWLAIDRLALGSRLTPAARGEREEGGGVHVSRGSVYKCPDVSITLEWKWRGSKREGQGLPLSVFSHEGGQGEHTKNTRRVPGTPSLLKSLGPSHVGGFLPHPDESSQVTPPRSHSWKKGQTSSPKPKYTRILNFYIRTSFLSQTPFLPRSGNSILVISESPCPNDSIPEVPICVGFLLLHKKSLQNSMF